METGSFLFDNGRKEETQRVIFIYLYGFGMWNVVRGRKIVSDVPFWMLAINLVSDAQ